MAERIGVWELGVNEDGKETASPLEELRETATEQRLESVLVECPHVLLPNLTLIGRQVQTASGPLDLLGVDAQGDFVVFELKRGTLGREAVSQLLDYASDLTARDPDDFAKLIEQQSGRHGIAPIEDFLDWYQREFPDLGDSRPGRFRLVLVGLGVDERTKRIVNFLAGMGVDIQLLTLQAFRSGDRILLARHVETVEPTKARQRSASQKEENQRCLEELAEQQGVGELLSEVANFVDSRIPSYRWPGTTSVSYYLAEQTEAGKPTQRAYASLSVDRRTSGQLLFALPKRAVEVAPAAVESAVSSVSAARRTSKSLSALEVPVSTETWPGLQGPLDTLLKEVVKAWRVQVERRNAEGIVAEDDADKKNASN